MITDLIREARARSGILADGRRGGLSDLPLSAWRLAIILPSTVGQEERKWAISPMYGVEMRNREGRNDRFDRNQKCEKPARFSLQCH